MYHEDHVCSLLVHRYGDVEQGEKRGEKGRKIGRERKDRRIGRKGSIVGELGRQKRIKRGNLGRERELEKREKITIMV